MDHERYDAHSQTFGTGFLSIVWLCSCIHVAAITAQVSVTVMSSLGYHVLDSTRSRAFIGAVCCTVLCFCYCDPLVLRCILRWDNSYSRLRGKRLCFVMESATPQTMRAAIEAAGAADHKRRTTLTRSAAAQMILDSDGSGRARVTVTAVGAGNEEDVNGEGNDNGSGRAGRADGSHDSGGYYRFGRVRRVAAALLRDLETMVDVRSDSVGNGSSFSSGRFVRGNRTEGGGGGESHGGGSSEFRRSSGKPGGNVEIEGVQKLVERFEQLEDEVASASARRAQCEAQAKVLLATLQKANTRADR